MLFTYKGETVEILAMDEKFGNVIMTLVTEDKGPWDVTMSDSWKFTVTGVAA